MHDSHHFHPTQVLIATAAHTVALTVAGPIAPTPPAPLCPHRRPYRRPHCRLDPGVDDWKLGRPTEGVPEKKTWQKERVFRDILEHRMTKFSNEQQQQWHALHQFHELYQTADMVPSLPISLQSPSGTSFTMEHGSPFDWDATWSKLAWRFDRPHKPPPTTEAADTAAAAVTGSSTDEGSTSKDGQAEFSKPSERDPAIINGATGGNAKKAKKKQAVRAESIEEKAKALPAKGIQTMAANELHFVVAPPDGESGSSELQPRLSISHGGHVWATMGSGPTAQH